MSKKWTFAAIGALFTGLAGTGVDNWGKKESDPVLKEQAARKADQEEAKELGFDQLPSGLSSIDKARQEEKERAHEKFKERTKEDNGNAVGFALDHSFGIIGTPIGGVIGGRYGASLDKAADEARKKAAAEALEAAKLAEAKRAADASEELARINAERMEMEKAALAAKEAQKAETLKRGQDMADKMGQSAKAQPEYSELLDPHKPLVPVDELEGVAKKAKDFVADHADVAEKITKKFGGLAGGAVIAGGTLLAGGSVKDATAAVVPGGDAVVAAVDGKPAESVFTAVEEVPIAGGVISEVGRSLLHSAGYAKTAEPGILEEVGGYIGSKAYDITHQESGQVDMTALKTPTTATADPTPVAKKPTPSGNSGPT